MESLISENRDLNECGKSEKGSINMTIEGNILQNRLVRTLLL